MRDRLSFLIAVVVAAPLWAQGAPSQDEIAEIESFLTTYYRHVVVVSRATSPTGDTISCVDVNHQPGMNHPFFGPSAVRTEPSLQLKAMLGRVAPAPSSQLCPTGTVEMKLPTRDQLIAAGSVRSFLQKRPPRRGGPVPAVDVHYYATMRDYGQLVWGAQSTINVWQPWVNWGDMSLSQIWISAGGVGSPVQTVEVGWQVLPSKYGTQMPVIFVYWTADGYSGTGCYNVDCPGFIQTSNALPIGQSVTPSTDYGPQVEGTVAWYKDPSTRDWVLFVQNQDGSYTQVGYYPYTLFAGGAFDYGSGAAFGGETYSGTRTPNVRMGSGRNPLFLSYAYSLAAYQRNLKFIPWGGGPIQDVASGGLTQDPTACSYGITTAYGASSLGAAWDWGRSIFFGGEGGC